MVPTDDGAVAVILKLTEVALLSVVVKVTAHLTSAPATFNPEQLAAATVNPLIEVTPVAITPDGN